MRVEIKPELLRRTIERSGVGGPALRRRFAKLGEWLAQTVRPTLKQAEDFSRATYTPIGFLFLPEPPDEGLPILDFRTSANEQITRPSANLLDTIYSCQQRQYWFALADTYVPLIFINGADSKSAQMFTLAQKLEVLY